MVKKEVDVTKHTLVPKHSVLTDKDKEALFEKYDITDFNLPKILKTDAAIRNLNVKEGDVLKIERESSTAGKIVYYRLVM